MKILILGSNGMAGHIITKYFKDKNYNVGTLARSDADFCVDIEENNQLENFFKSKNSECDFLINCIGLLVGESNNNPLKAIYINSYFPHYLEKKYNNTNTKIIHLSTDCVFDGLKGNYIESDIHTEINYYGRSKSLGEINNNKDITFRTSIIGPEKKQNGSGLFHWFTKSSPNKINGWQNAWWNGITTLQLAKCIEKYITNPKISGIRHLVNNKNRINKYDLLVKIKEIFDIEKTISPSVGPKEIDKVLLDTIGDLDFEITDYDTQLRELRLFL